MNKIVVMANARFEPGLVAFINSYRLSGTKTPLVIIDTGLNNAYGYETIKREFKGEYKKAEWMTDASPYLQLQLSDIDADKIIYLEADMLILKPIDHLFDYISDDNAISVMDDAALATVSGRMHIDSCGRFFVEGSELWRKYAREKGYNGGLVGGSKKFYEKLQDNFRFYLEHYEGQYRLLAQSLLNQYFIEEQVFVKDVGVEYNFSGINEYYDQPERYDIQFNGHGYDVAFNGVDISIVHFTGRHKPFLEDDANIMSPIFEFYADGGINVQRD